MAWEKLKIDFKSNTEKIPINIVADGSVLVTDRFEGRMIPAIIFDRTQRPDIDELIRVHEHIGLGDVNTIWKKPIYGKDICELFIEFKNPINTIARFVFTPSKHFALIYLLLNNKAIYLIPGTLGDKISSTMTRLKILIEITNKVDIKNWDNYFRSVLIKRHEIKSLPKKQKSRVVESFIEKMKEIVELRKKQ